MSEWKVDMSRANFKMECIKDCYGNGSLLYKAGNVYVFIDGECERETCGLSPKYTSFENFMRFNSNWKDNFIYVE